MKKYLFLIFSFLFLLFSSQVSAKEVTNSNIIASFGEEEILNLGYTSINSFKIREDKSFYFNGVKHQFNDDYSVVDNTINVSDIDTFEMENDTFTLDLTNMTISTSKSYQAYMFAVKVTLLNNNTYTFSQELCYKYGEIETCNSDIDDVADVSYSQSYNFYYDFMPFYDEGIVFDYIRYNFTFTKDNIDIDSSITFFKEEINYKDSFEILAYPSSYNNYYYSSYMGKEFVNLYGSYMYFNVNSFNKLDTTRNYDFYFYICLGNNYESCKKINDTPLSIDNTSAISNSDKLSLNLSSYLYSNNQLVYSSFKLKAEYVYKSGDDTYSRKQDVLTSTNEEIYYVSESTPYFKGEINGSRITCNYYYTCYASNSEVTNNILFEDDNGIIEVYYLVSNEKISDVSLINVEINNGDNISFGNDLEGTYYLYFRVFDGSGVNSSNINSPYEYIFDKTGPSLNGSNFDNYNSNEVYNDASINVTYKDNIFNSVSGIYYKVISESEYSSLTKQDIINDNNLYNKSVSIKEHINSDGLYRVCFVSYDYLNNYSETFNCSYSYYIDITALTKQEVSVSEVDDEYINSLNLTITIEGVEENTAFKCGIFNKDIDVNEVMLTSTCLNKVSNELTFLGEGEYSLWIYASDVVGNYNLIKLEEIYYLDNLAPRISYVINGDNGIYSNSVKLNVTSSDLNEVLASFYVFYQGSYENKEFTSFNIEEGINYPYNYYGEYKVAIKVCDVVNNCSINASNDIFKIDTGEIKLELVGKQEVVILRYGKYKEEGILISKGINNTRVNLDYSISGDIDLSKPGEYYLTYTSGTGMNEVSIVRKVIVKDSMPYFYLLIGSLLIGELIILGRLFIKKRKNDSI